MASEKPRAQPVRAVSTGAPQKFYRPAWVDEFNRETTEAQRGKKEQNRAKVEPRRWTEFDCIAIAEQEEAERQLTTHAAERPRNIFDWVLMHRTG
jgi:hypothetical protein